jgi:hypothetical protein
MLVLRVLAVSLVIDTRAVTSSMSILRRWQPVMVRLVEFAAGWIACWSNLAETNRRGDSLVGQFLVSVSKAHHASPRYITSLEHNGVKPCWLGVVVLAVQRFERFAILGPSGWR